jgi:hypothetical protein
MDILREFLGTITVRNCGLTKLRIGSKHDGGYVVAEELCRRARMVYSAGVGEDLAFEEQWLERWPKTRFILYDPNIESPPVSHEKFTFRRIGLGAKYKPLVRVKMNSTLKLDIEWDEWGAIQAIPDSNLERLAQIVVEFHIIHSEIERNDLSPYFCALYDDVMMRVNEDLFGLYYDTMRKLTRHFYIFHIHANNSLPLANYEGYWFPPLLEVSFVRKDLVRIHSVSRETFPIKGLDSPNKTDRPDFMDYYPLVENCHAE